MVEGGFRLKKKVHKYLVSKFVTLAHNSNVANFIFLQDLLLRSELLLMNLSI